SVSVFDIKTEGAGIKINALDGCPIKRLIVRTEHLLKVMKGDFFGNLHIVFHHQDFLTKRATAFFLVHQKVEHRHRYLSHPHEIRVWLCSNNDWPQCLNYFVPWSSCGQPHALNH